MAGQRARTIQKPPGLLRFIQAGIGQWMLARAQPPRKDPRFEIYTPPTMGANRYGLADVGDARALFAAFKSIVFACVNARAVEVAKRGTFVPYLETSPGEYRELELTHPLYALLRKPNPEITGYNIRYNIVAHLDISGNSYHWISRDARGNATGLWPIPPQNIKIVQGDPKANEELIKAYAIDWGNGNHEDVPASDIVHLRHPNPNSPYYYGASLMLKAATEIDIVEYINRYRREFFKHDAMPAGAVIFPKDYDVNEDVIRRFEEEWVAKFNSAPGSWAMLEGGADAKILGGDANAKEFGFLESWGINTSTIRAIFGVPKWKLMDDDQVESRPVAEAKEYMFLSGTIEPLLTMIAEQLTLDLAVPLFGPNFVIKATSTVPSDVERDARVDQVRIQTGTMTPNEARKKRAEEPLPGGDVAIIPTSYVPLEDITAPPEPPPAEPPPPPPPPPPKNAGMNGKALTDDAKRMYWKAKEGFRSRWELRVYREMRKYFNALKDEVLAKLDAAPRKALKAENNDQPVAVQANVLMFDLQKAIDELRSMMTVQMQRMLASSFKEFIDRYSVDGVVYAPNDGRVRYAIARVNAKTVTVPKDLHDALFKELDEGIRLQETAQQIAQRVRKFFADGSEWKSMRIARTVSNFGVNEGNRIAALDAGFTDKMWITMRDDRVRDPLHTSMDGVEIALNESFVLLNGDALQVPGDPSATQGESVINCRCTLFYTQKSKRG